MNQPHRQMPNPVSIQTDKITVLELLWYLSNYTGYLDGDRHTLELTGPKT